MDVYVAEETLDCEPSVGTHIYASLEALLRDPHLVENYNLTAGAYEIARQIEAVGLYRAKQYRTSPLNRDFLVITREPVIE